MKKNTLIFSIIGLMLALSLIFILFIQPATLSVRVSGQTVTVDIEENLAGHDVEIQASVDGKQTGGDVMTSPFTGNTATVEVCGSNDGDTSIETLHRSVGNKLIITISSSSESRGCENSIKGQVKLPKGVLIATCSLNAPIGSDATSSSCTVEGSKREIVTARSGVATIGKTENKMYKFIIEDERTIDFSLSTLARGSMPTAEIVLEFEEVECTEDSQCEDIDGEFSCNGDNLVQSVQEGKCNADVCGTSLVSKLVKECELGCDEVGGVAQCGEGVPLVEDWRFWVSLVIVLLIVAGAISFLIRR